MRAASRKQLFHALPYSVMGARKRGGAVVPRGRTSRVRIVDLTTSAAALA